jgi:hypothetical protein
MSIASMTRPSYMPKFVPRSYKSLADSAFDTDDALTASETDITLDAQDAGAAVLPIGTVIRIEDEFMYVSGNDGANPSVLTVVRGWASSAAVTHATNADIYIKTTSACVLYLEGQTDAQSGIIKDKSGYGNHGAITGATWVQLSSGLVVNRFDGTDDKIAHADNTFISLTSATIIAWVSTEDIATERVFFNSNKTASWGRVTFGISDIGKLYTYITNEVGAYDLVGNSALSVNHWYLAGWVFNATLGSLWINGQQQTDVDAASYCFADLVSTDRVQWGVPVSGSPWQGSLGLSRIFNRALTATEIAGIYQSERHLFNV